jgi:hypothetical protein
VTPERSKASARRESPGSPFAPYTRADYVTGGGGR